MDIRSGGLDHPDVQALLLHHLTQARATAPTEFRHALDVTALGADDVRFWTAWDGETLLGMAALRTIEPGHVEVKSMRTAPAALRRGVARALLTHLIETAHAAGATRVSLETGTHPMFDAANRLYEATGFVDGPVFGGYPPSPHNRFMTLVL
ncbi:GNAT family N-acetyltransferase [Sphingomonas bacterium]|uniref:GNAT family N-acetyltransferase n=1 Tax=Sphingomonas bacterium TaxID=1895847 RepID=UPI001574F1D5|nr:GNAT family N-acetyltransferase [Sphingomonas bacterium]